MNVSFNASWENCVGDCELQLVILKTTISTLIYFIILTTHKEIPACAGNLLKFYFWIQPSVNYVHKNIDYYEHKRYN